MKERRCAYKILVGKRERMIIFGSPRIGWKDNIKMGLQKVGLGHGLD